jgi:hypothetical protein
MNALSERLTDIKENGDRSTEAMQGRPAIDTLADYSDGRSTSIEPSNFTCLSFAS